MAELTYIEAINSALREELARDRGVYVIGEDVALGGPFGATKGLAAEFGERRVVNTPISEGAIMGLATGAAAMGLRPVIEVMFVDFITLAMDQLVNHAAKLHYMSGGQLGIPLTVRVQQGAAGNGGAQHSQSLEAWFIHVPGLKVVMPSNPADAKGLLTAAIRDDSPVICIEHRALYWTRGEVPDGEHTIPIGRAALRRPGKDVTLVATSRMVEVALEVAGTLANEGIEVEVIDPRSLLPLDLDTITASLRKTGRLVIAHEAVEGAGFGAELLAQVQEAAFDYLDAPIARVGAPFAPVPASPVLEQAFVPGAERLAGAVRKVVLGA
ncbi:MAG: alpha-ketoacid dehydrogenase subunit beta [Alphaproteobacteria bacterium]|nr:alpha-ketoacid dehydrogenase subunit beta [Alphaproteobacteria bacterium]